MADFGINSPQAEDSLLSELENMNLVFRIRDEVSSSINFRPESRSQVNG
jgi:hypothetical protein